MDLGCFEIGLNVQDIGQSLAFYQILGFKVVDGGVDIRAVTLRKADCAICIYQHRAADPVRLQFCQGDVEAIHGKLVREGVGFEKPPIRDHEGVSAQLRDPDGNALVFTNLDRHDTAPPDDAGAGPRGSRMDLGWFEASLAVQDIARSRDFYRKLGFQVVGPGEERYIALQHNDCRIGLFQGHLDPARTQLIFWQGEVEAIARDVTGRGLTFGRGPASDDKGTGAMLFDPDGNPLYFVNIRGVVREDV